jgi:predicted AlkP superfamily pyrophosphatase or phosphodiesterase
MIGRMPCAAALLIAALALAASCTNATPPPGAAAGAPAPRLIVLVVIDQFRADSLERYRDRFGPDGFNRLRRDAASFASCAYPYAVTETAPGHATLSTGSTPDRHGIIANGWYDARLGRAVPAVLDDAFPLVGAAPGLPGASPRNLVGTTFADELHLFTGGAAKVFGIALKDRAAIFSTGHTADGAFWYDVRSGMMVSSRYYGERLPAAVTDFNQRRPADRFYGKDWVVEGRTVVTLTTPSGAPDTRYYERLAATPYIHDYLAELGRALITEEDLGADAVPDFLFIGLSGHDWLGHEVGPYDPATREMSVHTDALLADLLEFLDGRLGRGHYWFVLSADHGVSPSVQQASDRGLRSYRLEQTELRDAVESALDARWGEDAWVSPIGGWSRVHFDRGALARHGVSLEAAAREAGRAAAGVPGVLGYVAGDGSTLDRATTGAFRLSSYPGRTPDLTIVPAPFVLLSGADAARHGSPYSYDRRVPLFLLGPTFRPGRYYGHASPADLAPTLAAALGMTPPARVSGRVLDEALDTRDDGRRPR